MGSRLKENPEQTFYWFFEATCPIAKDKDPRLLFQFPEDFDDEESSQTLPRFCFPYDIQRVREGVGVQHFTFVLTDLEGCQRFGFCRLTNGSHTCLCMLSYLPWFEVFYKLLNNLADYLTKGQTNEARELLAALYKQPAPLAAGSFTLQMGEQLLICTEVSLRDGHKVGQEGVPYFIAPDPRRLPSIPESRNLTELIVAVDTRNLLQLYASMLFERRILIFASKLSTLTACVHALNSVLYPMYWQHIFIPVLPPHLLDYCCAPMPYLIGVHTSLTEKVRTRGLEEVVILNVDTNTLETPFDDLEKIPPDVTSGLKLRLKHRATSPGCGVARAFLRAQALLFGGYRNALQQHKEDEVWFNEELFIEHKSSSISQFLQSAVHLQFFKQFIDSRLELFNKGKEPDDLFEEEILECGTATGTKKSYQQLVGNLRKGGGALIHNMKSKANMTAKGLNKHRFKNLLHKEQSDKHALQRGGSVSYRCVRSDCLQNRLPITQHFGRPRPRRPDHRDRGPREASSTKDTIDNWHGPVAEPDPEEQKDEYEREASMLCDPEEMDLLGEIFETLSSRSSHERGLLYGTRSLDLFGPDSHDYITKDGLASPSQKSPSLSISGSDSLHSWNQEEALESTEESKDPELPEDPEWPRPNPSALEEEESPLVTSEVGHQGGKARETKRTASDLEGVGVASNPNNSERDNINCEEFKSEEAKGKEHLKERAEQNLDKTMDTKEETAKEIMEKKANKESGNNTGEYIPPDEGALLGGQPGRQTEEPVETPGNLVRGETDTGFQKKEKGPETPGPLHRNQLMKSDPLSDRRLKGEEEEEEVEEVVPEKHQEQSESSVSRNYTADPNAKPSTGRDRKGGESQGKDERKTGRTISPPKGQSPAALLRSPTSRQSVLVRFQTEQWSSNGPFSADVRAEEQDTPAVKVSELKKRFEASLPGN